MAIPVVQYARRGRAYGRLLPILRIAVPYCTQQSGTVRPPGIVSQGGIETVPPDLLQLTSPKQTRPMTLPTAHQMEVIAKVIMEVFTTDMIIDMHSLDGGDEILRHIVRDDIGGAGDKISNALWVNL